MYNNRPHQDYPGYNAQPPQSRYRAPQQHGVEASLPGVVTSEDNAEQQDSTDHADIVSSTGQENTGYTDATNTNASHPETVRPEPPQCALPPDTHRPPEIFDTRGCISEHEVRVALLAYDRRNVGCLGSGSAKNMTLISFTICNALHYQLETFTESRATSYRYGPHQGGDIDCQRGINDHPPDLATMQCQPDGLFRTHSKDIRIPRTSEIQICHHCSNGLSKCTLCSGKGMASCKKCRGGGNVSSRVEGKMQRVTCGVCDGDKRTTCGRCSGEGKVSCGSCKGGGKLLRYRVLTVTYTNHVTDYVYEHSDLPKELVKNVVGLPVLQQTFRRVWPITQYQVAEINQNSARIVDEHSTAWPESRMLQQRQTLSSVPITEAHYNFKNTRSRFWVYGFEHDVHAPDYPNPTCGDCSIM